MKIQMKTLYAGPQGVMEAGSTHVVDDALGAELVNAQYAVRVDVPVVEESLVEAPVVAPEPEPEPETAALVVDPPIQKAVKPRTRRTS